MKEPTLNRGLSEGFLSSLLDGAMAPILCAAKAHDLDLQIREGYINLYDRGLSLLKLTACRGGAHRAEIHIKFLPGVQLPGERRRDDCYATFDADGDFAQRFASQLTAISVNAAAYVGAEAVAEQMLVRNSLRAGSSIVIIDRQLQVTGIPKRADVIGLTREAEPRLIIGEVKCGLNNDIQEIPEQVGHYYRVLTDHDGRLAESAACVYRRVVEQKRCLGLLPSDVSFPVGSPRVECLAILCDFNPRSSLLGRAQTAAENCGFTIHLVQPAGPDYGVPPMDEWEKLCP